MAVIKNKKTGMWEVRTYYKDLIGERKQKTKRGFAKKSEALEWERNFKLKENQYEFSKLCGYLFEGFGAENKTQYVPDKEAHY